MTQTAPIKYHHFMGGRTELVTSITEADMNRAQEERDARVEAGAREIYGVAKQLVDEHPVQQEALDRVGDLCFSALLQGEGSEDSLAIGRYRQLVHQFLNSQEGQESIHRGFKQGALTALNNPEHLSAYARSHHLIAFPELPAVNME